MLTLSPHTNEWFPNNPEYGRCSECYTVGDFYEIAEHLYVIGDRTPKKTFLKPCPECEKPAELVPACELLRLRFEG